MRRHRLKTDLLQTTDNVISTVTDLALTYVFFTFALTGAHGTYGVYRAEALAKQMVQTEINYRSIKTALYSLVKNHFLKKPNRLSPHERAVTELGFKRLQEILPQYHTQRPWNGIVFLVSYDVPSTHNWARDKLRFCLKRLGCGLLQESLWLTPYNPTIPVQEYVKTHHIPGVVLISKLGKDGAVGSEKLTDLVRSVYRLDALASRYIEYIDGFQLSANPTDIFIQAMHYLSILREDPQLPFALLPSHFPAAKAHSLYESLLKN